MRSFLVATFASLATIQSTQGHPYHSTPRGLSKRGVDLDSFRMKVPVSYTNAAAVGSDASIAALTRRATAADAATELVKKTAPGAEFRLVESYTGKNGVSHFFFKQTANGYDVDNGDFNVNVGGSS
jgi:extracellular elastinolytic metalloproteinase